MAAAKNNLHPEKMHVMVVGNAADFDEPLAALDYGPVDTIDITIPSGEEERELAITPENIERGTGLMAKAVAAHGGLEAFQKVSATHSKGTMTLKMQGRELPLQFDSYEMLPDHSHTVISFMGQTMYDYIVNGDEGWQTDPTTGTVTAKSQEDIDMAKDDNQRNTLMIFRQLDSPPYQAVYDGSGEINGTPVEFVALVGADGEVICRLGLNAATSELVSKSYWGQSPMGEGNILETFSDFKTYEGITMPMRVDRQMNGQEYGYQTTSLFEVNPTMPDGTFQQTESVATGIEVTIASQSHPIGREYRKRPTPSSGAGRFPLAPLFPPFRSCLFPATTTKRVAFPVRRGVDNQGDDWSGDTENTLARR